MSLITPRTAPGVMELLPKEQIAFRSMLDTIRQGYERFGFVPVETPVFETVEVLLGKTGGETARQVYFAQSTGSREQGAAPDLALRFDLTVPLARYVAEHEHELVFPFRRYQIQQVYRGERAQKGRFREFYQCDVDIIGKDALSPTVDAELPAVIHQVFTALNVGKFTVQLNNRKLLRGVLQHAGVATDEQQAGVLREIDKLDKMGREKVLVALAKPELGLPDGAGARVLDLLEAPGTTEDTLRRLRALASPPEQLVKGLEELETVVTTLGHLGVPESAYKLNLTVARGLDYYTGTIYETRLDELPEFGSVCSGGRYDDLASHYTKSKLPGVGVSIGATRLFQALLEKGVIQPQRGGASVLVAQLDPALGAQTGAMARTLREAGISTELFLEGGKVPKQMKYAERAGIPVTLLYGPDEHAKGVVAVKNMAARTQELVPHAELVAAVKRVLGG